jgi:hypothetical protein
MFSESPVVAVGIAPVAAGLAIGLAIPETSRERESLGGFREEEWTGPGK